MGMVNIIEYWFIINIIESLNFVKCTTVTLLKYEVLFGKHYRAHTFSHKGRDHMSLRRQ